MMGVDTKQRSVGDISKNNPTDKEKKPSVVEWRKFAKGCKYRHYDGERKPWKGSLGNPLCGYSVVGMRCTYRECPYVKK